MLVVTPRLTVYGENYTDHQIELAAELDRQGRAALVSELSGGNTARSDHARVDFADENSSI